MAEGQAIPAKVEAVEPTGAVTYIYARIGATPVCAAYSGRELPRPGQTIGLSPQPDRIHLFDARSEARIGQAR